MIEYVENGNKERAEIWGKVFLDACKMNEFVFFNNRGIREGNPVNPNEIPQGIQNFGYVTDYYFEQLKGEISSIQKFFPACRVKEPLGKLYETAEFVTTVKIKDGNKIALSENEILAGYAINDLGLKKWAIEIVNSLN